MTNIELEPWLGKLEDLIDPGHVERVCELQRRTFAFEPVDHVPTVINYPLPEKEWPCFSLAEIYEDPVKMLLSELARVYVGAKLKDDRLYAVRANYGTGIIASMFGCEIRTFQDSLPIGLHIEADRMDNILDAGMPDVRAGIVGRALDTVCYFREALAPYPKLSRNVGIQILDIQGPFDNASIIWGSEIFMALYDVPEKIIRLSEIITETTFAVVREHRRIDGGRIDEHGGAWQHLGGLCVRNDSSVNLDRDHYEQFAKPFDVRMIGELGGWIHFCGRAHQWWESLLDIQGLRGINPYQGEFYDLVGMFGKCEHARIPIVQWTTPLDAECRERVRTGFSRSKWVESYDEALRNIDRLNTTGHSD